MGERTDSVTIFEEISEERENLKQPGVDRRTDIQEVGLVRH
jgi:hypothetical protein